MKLGAQPGLTERRNSGPTGRLSETIVAAWNFGSRHRHDHLPRMKAPIGSTPNLVNCPNRGMTGFNWAGHRLRLETCAWHKYGAISFHDDDVDDARWSADFAWTVPETGVKSRFYAAKLTTSERR